MAPSLQLSTSNLKYFILEVFLKMYRIFWYMWWQKLFDITRENKETKIKNFTCLRNIFRTAHFDIISARFNAEVHLSRFHVHVSMFYGYQRYPFLMTYFYRCPLECSLWQPFSKFKKTVAKTNVQFFKKKKPMATAHEAENNSSGEEEDVHEYLLDITSKETQIPPGYNGKCMFQKCNCQFRHFAARFGIFATRFGTVLVVKGPFHRQKCAPYLPKSIILWLIEYRSNANT